MKRDTSEAAMGSKSPDLVARIPLLLTGAAIREIRRTGAILARHHARSIQAGGPNSRHDPARPVYPLCNALRIGSDRASPLRLQPTLGLYLSAVFRGGTGCGCLEAPGPSR